MHALPIDSGDVGEMRDTDAVQGRRREKLLRHVAVRVTVSEQQQRTLDGHRLTNKWAVLRPTSTPFKQQQDCRCIYPCRPVDSVVPLWFGLPY